MATYQEQAVLEAPAIGSTTVRSVPIEATLSAGSANFSVFSRGATGIELLFFDRVDDARPSRVIPIDPCSYHYWRLFVPAVQAGQIYGFRASKLLLDPYGRAIVVPENYGREAARPIGDNSAMAMKNVVTDLRAYDWEDDAPLKRRRADDCGLETDRRRESPGSARGSQSVAGARVSCL
jgi:glycogen operon protein